MHMVSPKRLYFESFTLELTSCALLRGTQEIRLRPKAFDVLRYLVEHAGRLVSKEELIKAVWPGVFVTDDSLVQCVGDIRVALTDDAHRIIKTVPRRGYLFASEVSTGGIAYPASVQAGDLLGPPLRPVVPTRWHSRWVVGAILLLVLVGTAASVLWRRPQAPSLSASGEIGRATVAAEVHGPERRVALVIGNSHYGASTFANALRDADAVADALRRVGFAEVTVGRDLSREQVVASLRAFAKEAQEADWAVVYFVGKGLEVGGRSYLMPVGAAPASEREVPYQGVALDDVLRTTNGAKKVRLVILDACRENPFASTAATVASGLPGADTEFPQAGRGRATLVAYATRHGGTAEDGPFAAALVRNLETPGLEVNLLFRKVRDEVLAATGGRQEPFIYGSLPSDSFYFRSGS
jgi:DNA-binding winged helix-turn-helix (wHTH) protein